MADWVHSLIGKKKETLTKKLNLLLTKSEKEFVFKQSEEECTSQNSIVRKAISDYRKKMETPHK